MGCQFIIYYLTNRYMKKLSILGFLAAFVALFAFSGCGAAEPDKSAEEVVREGLSNLYSGVQSAKYEVDLSLDAEAPEGEEPESIKANLMLSGVVDQKDPKKPKMTLKIEGDATIDNGDKEAVSAEIRMNETAMYAMVSKLPSMDGMIPAEMVEPYLSQWYMMEIPPGTLDDPALETLMPGKELTEEQKKIKELLSEVDLLEDLSYEGSEKIMGDESYHYKGKLSNSGVKELFDGLSEIYGETGPSQDEVDEMLEPLEDLTVEIWVGTDDMIIRKMAVSVVAKPPTGGTFNVEFSYAIGDINKDVTIEVPEDTKGVEELMTLFFGAAMAMPTDSEPMEGEFGDYDMGEMEDFDMEEFDADMAELEAELAELEELNVELEELEKELEAMEDL